MFDPASPPQILLVDDDPSVLHVLRGALAGIGRLRCATGAEDAWRLAEALPPDIILLDAEMPGMNGFDLCQRLKQHRELCEVPVIFVTSHRSAAHEIEGFAAGAADFVHKPVQPPLLRARVLAQLRTKAMADELRRLSSTDALTGVGNRRRFEAALAQELSRAARSHAPLALLLVDVDHFKLYNDEYGHPAGDDCLAFVARKLALACQRPADGVFRYGGEEFAVLLPNTTADGAMHVARRILDSIELDAWPHRGSPTADRVTASIGVAVTGEWDNQPEPLLARSDRALYRAKRNGRRGVCIDQEGATSAALPVAASMARADAPTVRH